MMIVVEFKNYLLFTSMPFSYKAVLVLALANKVDPQGKASRKRVIREFRRYYLERQQKHLPTELMREHQPSPMLQPESVTDSQIWELISRFVLPTLQGFINIDEEYIYFEPELWDRMRAGDFIEIREIALNALASYYDRFAEKKGLA